jgi:hypothetical protein
MMVSRRKIENFNLRRKVPLINENRASEGKPKNFIVFLLKMDHRALPLLFTKKLRTPLSSSWYRIKPLSQPKVTLN